MDDDERFDRGDRAGGVGDEPGGEPDSETPHLVRGSGLPDPERASAGQAAFDPDLAEGGALPRTDALDPPQSGVPLSDESRAAAPPMPPPDAPHTDAA